MASGVLVVDGRGVIETLNPAAAELLGLEPQAVLGSSFAEVFVAEAAFEEFNEAVLAAIYDGVVGHQRIVGVPMAGRRLPLAVAASYLGHGSESAQDRRAVVAVFSDVSELEGLRERESALAADLQAKHGELRSAYRDLESRNRELDTLLRRVQTARVAASAGVIALTVAIGAWVWTASAADVPPAQSPQAAVDGRERRLVTVEPGPITATINVPGEIRPRGEVAVNSPISGQVGAVHVKRGHSVRQGQPLVDLDVTQVQIQGRRARAAYLRAKGQVEEFTDWSAGIEVSRARRAVAKARIALEAAITKLEETGFLVERGLIPSASRDAAEREQQTRRLDLETAEQDLAAVVAQGRENREVARLELQNASAELESIDWALENATIVAPVDGVVVSLQRGSGLGDRTLTAGASIQAGEHLMTIGDMEGVTVTGRVDEVEIGRIRAGQGVSITGPAFSDVALDGSVAQVSSQALTARGQHELPSFEVTAVVDALDERQRAAIRLGMSAQMEIVVHENDAALTVPFAAVSLDRDKRTVRLWDAAEGVERLVEVTTGVTTLDAVEILAGIEPGDRVIVP